MLGLAGPVLERLIRWLATETFDGTFHDVHSVAHPATWRAVAVDLICGVDIAGSGAVRKRSLDDAACDVSVRRFEGGHGGCRR